MIFLNYFGIISIYNYLIIDIIQYYYYDLYLIIIIIIYNKNNMISKMIFLYYSHNIKIKTILSYSIFFDVYYIFFCNIWRVIFILYTFQ